MTPESETALPRLPVHAAATPMTVFLVGVAAGRAGDPAVAARDYVGKLSPANDQSARG